MDTILILKKKEDPPANGWESKYTVNLIMALVEQSNKKLQCSANSLNIIKSIYYFASQNPSKPSKSNPMHFQFLRSVVFHNTQ